jgi:hypothetical protein
LKSTQATFKKDIDEIKRKVTLLNQELKKDGSNKTYQIVKLQEGLADERDSLYNVETGIKLPFQLRSCQSYNLTDSQRQQMKTQIE